ncbi:MAG: hypothetical protein P9L95_01790 [Candidatus Tenebribacter mawsonii]|nr:hypothetical protein [Candidatus Tenebribacter mawsonii]
MCLTKVPTAKQEEKRKERGSCQTLGEFKKIEEMFEHFMIYQRSVERILGAPPDSFQTFDKDFFDAFKTAYIGSK